MAELFPTPPEPSYPPAMTLRIYLTGEQRSALVKLIRALPGNADLDRAERDAAEKLIRRLLHELDPLRTPPTRRE